MSDEKSHRISSPPQSENIELNNKKNPNMTNQPNTQNYSDQYRNAPENKSVLCFKKDVKWEDMPSRMIYTNIPDLSLPNNRIQTSKYNWITFVPKNLLEQFSKAANLYFLIIGGLQLIKEISTSDGTPVTWAPLFVIILISALKDLFEDLKRHRSDNEENSRKTLVLKNNEFQSTKWQDLCVGDIVKVKQNEYFPADMVIIRTSEKKGVCFIETKNLDGETNLKHKQADIKFASFIGMTDSKLNEQRDCFQFEKPNPYLYTFTGNFEFNSGEKIPLDQNNFILRGCSLRNTKEIIGLIAYTGHDTKIMLNSVKARAKSSKMEKTMSRQIVTVFGMQLLVCFFSALYSATWYAIWKDELTFLEIDQDGVKDNAYYYNLFVRFGNWIIIFQNFVPISLLVTLEMVKFLQGTIISSDKKLISTETNIPVAVQTSSLNEELGQVQYIFSDKTGTLTCNIMEFKNISINGTSYGNDRNMLQVDFEKKTQVTNVDFRDSNFFRDLENTESNNYNHILETLFCLSLCHTIITEEKNGEVIYNASSPDELALVNFARYVGNSYEGTDENGNMIIKFKDSSYRFKLLKTLEFNSTRKRQSVIVKDSQGRIILFTKGADSIIEKRMNIINKEVKDQTWVHLEKYASIGLRTLVLAKRQISEDEYFEWERKYHVAQTSMTDREAKMEAVQEEIEKDLILVGATAIEDKLQDEVGDTIAYLKKSGIKVWVLTGDKIETAINIGYSCQLLNDELHQIIIDGKEESQVIESLEKGIAEIGKNPSGKFALVISGEALIHGMKDHITDKIMEVGEVCNAVIACRVSPKQKQEVVSLVRKKKPNVTTLAIGDGANDVNMITAAHVGIGIKGVEGQQAARASDYAVGEFKTLRRLLLYYGRECYRKNSHLICYNFFKNMVLVTPQLWFAFLNGFSAQNMYDSWLFQLYNICYSSLPIVIYSLFDEEYTGEHLERNPFLYVQGMEDKLFNSFIFFGWIFFGMWQACIITLSSFFVMESFPINSDTGEMFTFWGTGMVVFGAVIIVTNFKVLLFSNTHTVISLFVILGSILFYYMTYGISSATTITGTSYNTISRMFSAPPFYLVLIFQITVTNLFDCAFNRYLYFDTALSTGSAKKYVNREQESPLHIQMNEQNKNIREADHKKLIAVDGAKFQRKYTGYAYSQEEPIDDFQKIAQN